MGQKHSSAYCGADNFSAVTRTADGPLRHVACCAVWCTWEAEWAECFTAESDQCERRLTLGTLVTCSLLRRRHSNEGWLEFCGCLSFSCCFQDLKNVFKRRLSVYDVRQKQQENKMAIFPRNEIWLNSFEACLRSPPRAEDFYLFMFLFEVVKHDQSLTYFNNCILYPNHKMNIEIKHNITYKIKWFWSIY